MRGITCMLDNKREEAGEGVIEVPLQPDSIGKLSNARHLGVIQNWDRGSGLSCFPICESLAKALSMSS